MSFTEIRFRNKRNLWIPAFLCAGAALVLITLLSNAHYENGDDYKMCAIASGAYAEPDAHLLFVNVFIGAILKALIRAVPVIPWYGLFQYVTLFLSFSALIYLVLRKRTTGTYLAGALLLVFMAYEFFSSLQFSKVSEAAAVAGILLIVEDHEKSLWQDILGIALNVLALMYRWDAYLLIVLLLSGYIAVSLFHKKGDANKKENLRKPILLGIVCLLCTVAFLADFASYRDEWGSYRSYWQHGGFQLNDHGYPDYNENTALYEDLDINENALKVYEHWDFADPERYTPEAVNSLYQAGTLMDENAGFLGFFRNVVFPWFARYPYCWALCGVFLIFFLTRRKASVSVYLTLLLFLFIQIGMYVTGRVGVNRVDAGMFLAVGMTAVLAAGDTKKRRSVALLSAAGAFILACILLNRVMASHEASIDSTGFDSAAKAAKEAYYDLLEQDPEHVYIIGELANEAPLFFDPWDTVREGSVRNRISLGGWMTYSPVYQEWMESHQFENLYRELAENEEVYLIHYPVYLDRILEYLNDYYGTGFYGVMIRDLGEGYHPTYRITTEERKKNALQFDLDAIPEANGVLTDYSEIHPGEGSAALSGSLYLDGDNSFYSEYYAVLCDKETGEQFPFYLTQGVNPFAEGLTHGDYSAFYGTLTFEKELSDYEIYVIYKNGDHLYKLMVSEDRIIT